MTTVPVVTDYGPDSGGRLKGVTIVKPIVVGNNAKYFGRKREEDGHTHTWTVYLKPYGNEDYSCFIKKVHFKLHDSYANPNRILTKPPYEVTETGWGEFEVVIKIYFHDPIERAVTVYHILKLFQHGADPSNPIAVKKPVISETYDEIIFQEPTLLMKSLLDSVKPLTHKDEWRHNVDFEEKKKQSLDMICTAREKVKGEVQSIRDKLNMARELIEKYKERVKEVQRGGGGGVDKDSTVNTSSTASSSAFFSSMEVEEPTPGCSKDIF